MTWPIPGRENASLETVYLALPVLAPIRPKVIGTHPGSHFCNNAGHIPNRYRGMGLADSKVPKVCPFSGVTYVTHCQFSAEKMPVYPGSHVCETAGHIPNRYRGMGSTNLSKYSTGSKFDAPKALMIKYQTLT